MNENTSGLEPEGRAVLIRPYVPDQGRKSLIEIPEHVREKSSMMENRAEVIAVGAACWDDEPRPRAKVGDKVLVTRLAGFQAKGPRDGKIYRLVNDRDIFCRITHEGADND